MGANIAETAIKTTVYQTYMVAHKNRQTLRHLAEFFLLDWLSSTQKKKNEIGRELYIFKAMDVEISSSFKVPSFEFQQRQS